MLRQRPKYQPAHVLMTNRVAAPTSYTVMCCVYAAALLT